VKAEAAAKPKDTLRVPAHVRHEDGRRLSQQEYLEYVSYDDGPVKEHGVYRARNPLVEPVFADDGGRVVPVVKRRPVPEHLLMREDDEWDAKLTINWDEVEKKVGLDAQESAILRLRRRGFTRTMILQQVARNNEERRAWQAAWRRLDRKMGRLRAVLAGEQK
jgi:hypothetical protein